jgi:hypothetical protein
MSFSDTRNRISQSVHEITDSSRRVVGQHPMSTTLLAYTLGVGVGVALVYLAAGDSHRHYDAGFAHHFGRRVLDAIANAMPETLTSLKR